MEVHVDVRGATEVSGFLRTLYADQLPFINSSGINSTAKDFQKAEREHMHDIFTIRRKSFVERSVKIKPFATKTSQEARISIDSPGGRSDIIGKFETDTIKGPFRGSSVAVPTSNVPRTGTGVIKKGFRPRELLAGGSVGTSDRFLPGGGVLVGNEVVRGPGGFFMIRKSSGKGTIFLRHQGRVMALYQLVPRVRIRPELDFEVTARRTVNEMWIRNWTRAFDRAIRTAR